MTMATTNSGNTISEEILRRISHSMNDIERLINTHGEFYTAKARIQAAKNNLDRISDEISLEKYHTISQSLSQLTTICDQSLHPSATSDHRPYQFVAPCLHTGRCGRPKLDVSKDQLEMLQSKGYTASVIAKTLNCSSSYVYKKLKTEGIPQNQKYSNITEDELNQKVKELHEQFPNSGNEMMAAHLRENGITVQRTRVRRTLSSIDPIGTAQRWGRTVQRRTYRVACPNSLWHMDAHMKLNRWGFITHGCIDGNSRLIPYLACSLRGDAEVVASFFIRAAVEYGVPSRVRSDYGGENTYVAIFMNIIRGVDRGSHITGQSVHNQRIERLWKDVFTQVIEQFYSEFYLLEDQGLLDVANDIQLFSLRFIYCDIINQRLESFRGAWNKHRLRTMNNKSPEHLWLEGMLQNCHSELTSSSEVFGATQSLLTRFQNSVELNELNNEGEIFAAPEFENIPSELHAEPINEIKSVLKEEFINNPREQYLQFLERIANPL